LEFNIKIVLKNHETPSATKGSLEASQFINAQDLALGSVKKMLLLETDEGEINSIRAWCQ